MTDSWAYKDVADLRDDDDETSPWIGKIVDESAEDVVSTVEQAFEWAFEDGREMTIDGRTVQDREEWQEIDVMKRFMRAEQSSEVNAAVRDGKARELQARTGFSGSNRIDATGYQKLVEAAKPAAQQILIKGPKGSGKTTKALDLARHLYQEFNGDLSVLTNIRRSEDEPIKHDAVDYADSVSGMLEWVRDTPGEKLIIGDEWSSTVNSHANMDGSVRKTFSQFINALRKGEGGSTRLLAIGHEHDTDIAAIVRNQSDVVVQADGKVDEGLIAKATVFRGWQDYKEEEEWFKLRGMLDVPDDSPWAVSTNYFATFDVDLDNPGKQIQKGKLVECWQQYQDNDEELRLVKCKGVRTNGGGCEQMTDHKSGYCHHHRDQWDGETIDDRHDIH